MISLNVYRVSHVATNNHQVIVYWIILSKKLCINMSRYTNRHIENRAEIPDSFEVKQIKKEKVQFVDGRIGTFFLNSLESNRMKTLFPRRLNKDCRLVYVCLSHGWANRLLH